MEEQIASIFRVLRINQKIPTWKLVASIAVNLLSLFLALKNGDGMFVRNVG
jgi:hypothetical protein